MFTVANILTGFNLLFGVSSIIFTFSGRLELAVLAIIAGALCDFLDGFVARLMKQPSELGKQLDSLADLVTFGVAPGLIVFVLLILSGAWDIILESGGGINELWIEGTMGFSVQLWISVFLNDLVGNNSPFLPNHFYGWYKVMPFFALLIPFMSMFRLAKFNLDVRQATGFIGLPTPANSLFFASFALLLWDGFGQDNWKTVLSMTFIKDQMLLSLVILFSILLVAEIPLFALKFKSFKWKGNEIRYSFLLASLVLILILWVWAIPIIVLMYILLSVVNNMVLKKNS
ncbi:CDP-alcohol phosphatidyltransferase family protein [Brumimicrobium mesophilum]|uniref:CDP-alcohol phosphatidyltransferase family protein n=1 Tax=Brumimicrobium mesophilum TaxID=392717 RepID=UPI000D14232F|nr:CDP-alcohol phosphatidyltransferase family protein [Brumimicrobium mesophilum]